MFRVATASLVALLFAAPAFAQEAAYEWSGFYVGANGGYGWGLDNSVDLNYAPPCVAAPTHCPETIGINPEGALAGGHIGANWQHNMWLLGVEGDADWTDISDATTLVAPGPTTVTAATSLEWLATIRARAGITANRGLIYATGGLAFGEVDNSATLTSGTTAIPGLGGGLWSGSESDVQVGWAAGAGAEFAATDHLVVGIEALYVDLGDNSVALNKAPPVATPVLSADFENNYVIARGRLSWKW